MALAANSGIVNSNFGVLFIMSPEGGGGRNVALTLFDRDAGRQSQNFRIRGFTTLLNSDPNVYEADRLI